MFQGPLLDMTSWETMIIGYKDLENNVFDLRNYYAAVLQRSMEVLIILEN